MNTNIAVTQNQISSLTMAFGLMLYACASGNIRYKSAEEAMDAAESVIKETFGMGDSAEVTSSLN